MKRLEDVADRILGLEGRLLLDGYEAGLHEHGIADDRAHSKADHRRAPSDREHARYRRVLLKSHARRRMAEDRRHRQEGRGAVGRAGEKLGGVVGARRGRADVHGAVQKHNLDALVHNGGRRRATALIVRPHETPMSGIGPSEAMNCAAACAKLSSASASSSSVGSRTTTASLRLNRRCRRLSMSGLRAVRGTISMRTMPESRASLRRRRACHRVSPVPPRTRRSSC